MRTFLGIDIGGSGIKGAPVNIDTGELEQEYHRIRTPKSGKPAPVAKTVAGLANYFQWEGPIGCGFPAVVRGGVVLTAANIHKSWIGVNAENLFGEVTGHPTQVINDADAAGIAEMRFGAGKKIQGVVIVLTIGTGIGSAIFTDGHLVPNTEFGHLNIRGKIAERRASDATREEKELSWKGWAKRINEFLVEMETLFWPDLIILGGGVSKTFEKYSGYLTVKTEIVPAQLLNMAGIVGAALSVGEGVLEQQGAITPGTSG